MGALLSDEDLRAIEACAYRNGVITEVDARTLIAEIRRLRPPTRPSSDGPMQKCFSCDRWCPVDGPAKCPSCRPSAMIDDPYGHEEP